MPTNYNFRGFAGSSYNAREVGEAFRLLKKGDVAGISLSDYGNGSRATPEIKAYAQTGLARYRIGELCGTGTERGFGSKDIMDAGVAGDSGYRSARTVDTDR